METIPVNSITVNEELGKDGKTKYYTISGNIGNYQYYRIRNFETKEMAEEFGRKLLKSTE